MPVSAVGEQFERVCRDRAGTVAVELLPPGTSPTFADLAAERTAIEHAFSSLGVGRGAVVVSFVGNHSIFFSLVVASLNVGAALVPLGDATESEAVALIDRAGAVAVITDRALPFTPVRELSLGSGMRLLRLADRRDPPQYGSSVVLKLTSGSTDLPKAAVAAEAHLVNDGRHIIQAMNIGPTDVNMACIPLSHSYAIGNVVMPLLWQGTRVVLRRSFHPAQFLRDVGDSGATVFPGVPFMFERIRSLEGTERLPASLRLLITAGARIDPGTVVWFHRRFNQKVHSFYGSSETGGIAYDDSEDVRDPLDVGHAMPETLITTGPPERDDSAGRIFVQGNAVASEYAAFDEHDSPSGFIRGGFLTGDLGYVDGDRLVLTGRVSQAVNVAGRKVDPAEVERKLQALPGIADALVLGMACDTRGQQVVAFLIRTDSALTPLAIRQWCAETLSTHKIPRRFIFVDHFPVDARGKIDRGALQRLGASVDEG